MIEFVECLNINFEKKLLKIDCFYKLLTFSSAIIEDINIIKYAFFIKGENELIRFMINSCNMNTDVANKNITHFNSNQRYHNLEK